MKLDFTKLLDILTNKKTTYGNHINKVFKT